MELSQIMEEMRTYVRSRFEIGESDAVFDDDVHLFDYGYIDSFGAVDLTQFSESKYGIEISNDDLIMHPLNTIREISVFVHGRLNGSH